MTTEMLGERSKAIRVSKKCQISLGDKQMRAAGVIDYKRLASVVSAFMAVDTGQYNRALEIQAAHKSSGLSWDVFAGTFGVNGDALKQRVSRALRDKTVTITTPESEVNQEVNTGSPVRRTQGIKERIRQAHHENPTWAPKHIAESLDVNINTVKGTIGQIKRAAKLGTGGLPMFNPYMIYVRDLERQIIELKTEASKEMRYVRRGSDTFASLDLYCTIDAPDEVIDAAHSALAKMYHPDNNPNGLERMAEINASYSVIIQRRRREQEARQRRSGVIHSKRSHGGTQANV